MTRAGGAAGLRLRADDAGLWLHGDSAELVCGPVPTAPGAAWR